MGKSSSRKRIRRSDPRPARSARRAAAEPVIEPAAPAEPVIEAIEPAAPAAEPVIEAIEPAAPAEPAARPEPAHHEVAQLAFRFFAEAGFAHGHALEHWLRAEDQLRGPA
jgi:hypothetical protein